MGWLLLIWPPRMALIDPDGVHVTALDKPLSGLFARLGETTARKYGNALRRFLTAAAARSADLPALFVAREPARRRITQLLARAGCRLDHHRLPDGGILVTAPEPLVPTIDAALTTLSHLYDGLFERDHIAFANPVSGDGGTVPPGGQPAAWLATRHFVLANRRVSLPRDDDPHCIAEVLDAARDWPPGIRLAAHFAAGIGPRIGEVLDYVLRDWAAAGFQAELHCRNKGSSGRRTKRVHLAPEALSMLLDYVDGDRRRLTAIGLDDLRRLWRADSANAVFDQPLLLNTLGRKIGYSLFNDHYFRPAMRARGIAKTPHWMRHEQTYEGLLAIDRIARDEAEREALIEDFAGLQGWSTGSKMADYYAPQINDGRQRDLAHRLASELATPRARGLRPASAPGRSARALTAILAAGGA
jgi:hypothetical protein